GSHVGSPPGRKADRLGIGAEILEMTGEQVFRRSLAQSPGGRRRHGAIVERVEVPPGRQDVETAAGRCARWSRCHQPAIETLEHRIDLLPAALTKRRTDSVR